MAPSTDRTLIQTNNLSFCSMRSKKLVGVITIQLLCSNCPKLGAQAQVWEVCQDCRREGGRGVRPTCW